MKLANLVKSTFILPIALAAGISLALSFEATSKQIESRSSKVSSNKALNSKTKYIAPGPYDSLSESLYLYDETRDKQLEYVISYPDSMGKFPLIVFSHGLFGKSGMYAPLVDHWVSHGYICIQPTHEDSIKMYGRQAIRQEFISAYQNTDLSRQEILKNAVGKWKTKSLLNWSSRPLDVKLILDSLSQIEKDSGMKEYRCSIDEENIGMGGHSFGAHTSQVVGGTIIGGTTKFEDKRPKAILLVSPQGKQEVIGGRKGNLNEDSWKNFTRPMMLITGTNDKGMNKQPYQWRLDPFKYSPAKDKYLTVIDGAYHGFGGINYAKLKSSGPKNEQHVNLVRVASLAFWDDYLKNSKQADSFLKTKKLSKLNLGKVSLAIK